MQKIRNADLLLSIDLEVETPNCHLSQLERYKTRFYCFLRKIHWTSKEQVKNESFSIFHFISVRFVRLTLKEKRFMVVWNLQTFYQTFQDTKEIMRKIIRNIFHD